MAYYHRISVQHFQLCDDKGYLASRIDDHCCPVSHFAYDYALSHWRMRTTSAAGACGLLLLPGSPIWDVAH